MMRESDYLRVCNLACLRNAMTILGYLNPGHGISAEEIAVVARILQGCEQKLSKVVENFIGD